ncbi:type II secretion system minor pseudopilin GspK [Pseudoduganella lurida]|nr:type II secretion system minor pseudopilin GspK [Pseudoduganella lurida]
MPLLRRQQGVAIVLALLLMVLAVTLTASLFLPQHVWLRETENLAAAVRARALHRAVLDAERQILRLDAMTHGPVTIAGGTWSRPADTGPMTAPLPAAQAAGRILIRVSDAQGRFNLTNLATHGQPDAAQTEIFRQLLQAAGLDTTLAERAASAIAGTQAASGMAWQGPMAYQRLDDLRAIDGFDDRVLAALRQRVVVLPERTAINVNTASRDVLAAALTPALAATLADGRDRAYLRDHADIAGRLPDAAPAGLAALDVKSAYFLVELHIAIGRMALDSETLVRRRWDSRIRDGDDDRLLPTRIVWTRAL